MKKYYRFLLLFVMILGSTAKAACTIDGGAIAQYDFQLVIGEKMSTEYRSYEIDCTLPSEIRFNTKVEDDIKENFKTLQEEIPARFPTLDVTIDIRPVDGSSYSNYRKRWYFLGKNYLDYASITGRDRDIIPKGKYTIELSNVNPDYQPREKAPYYPWPPNAQVLFWVGSSTFMYNEVTITPGGEFCTSDSYQIMTLPSSTIDFGELDRKDLQSGKSFSQPFSIDISRVPGDECYELVYPNIEFYSETSLLGNNNTDIILDNGLLLRIKDSNGQPIVFGDKINLGKIKATDQRLQGSFKGEIRKNPERSVKTGEFNAIVRYIVHMR